MRWRGVSKTLALSINAMSVAAGRLKAAATLVLLLAGLASGLLAQAGTAPAASAPPATPTAATPASPATAPTKLATPPAHSTPNRRGRAGMYYQTVWGIDSLSVKWAESGELVRVTWRVVDAERAKLLNDKKAEPSLEDPKAGVSLVVPVMEKVGQLRQTAAPENGRSYWVAFSNAGRRVKQGDRVNVVIGPFRADNLVVE
jgi:hypothetical protein